MNTTSLIDKGSFPAPFEEVNAAPSSVALSPNLAQNTTAAMLASSDVYSCEQQPRKIVKPKRKCSNARMGYCEHPKHIIYRQEQPTYISIASPESDTPCAQGSGSRDKAIVRLSVPRRGRPPKGTRAIDLQTISMVRASSSDVPAESNCLPLLSFPWKMTVRPLPKRLEDVVGCEHIRVCLTCLKRSDQDPEYLNHPRYIGPTQKPAAVSRRWSNVVHAYGYLALDDNYHVCMYVAKRKFLYV